MKDGWQRFGVVLLLVGLAGQGWVRPVAHAEVAQGQERQRLKAEVERRKKESQALKKEVRRLRLELLDQEERLKKAERQLEEKVAKALEALAKQANALEAKVAAETLSLQRKMEEFTAQAKAKEAELRQVLEAKVAAETSSLQRKMEEFTAQAKAKEAELRQVLEAKGKALEAEGKRRMAEFYMRSGQQEEGTSLSDASRWYRKACSVGEAAGCAKAWQVEWKWAQSVERDPSRWGDADRWYQAACKGGFTEGCQARGAVWFARGKTNVGKDHGLASYWLKTACGVGYPQACQYFQAYALLRQAKEAEGRSSSEAIAIYQKACSFGVAEGCLGVWKVGLVQVKVLESQLDQWEVADRWYEAACKGGFTEGCAWRKEAWFVRGEHFRTSGLFAQSLAWYEKACSVGHPQACKRKEELSLSAGKRQSFEADGQIFAMRYIPAGSFSMGSPDDEKGRDSDEGPQRTVRITRSFWMLETEVTQDQYKALVGNNPSHFTSCGGTCPVESVSWHDAAAFANKLSAQVSLPSCFTCKEDGTCDIPDRAAYLACTGWRLPTEAEWEYAARAGTTTRFHTGDCITTDQANFDGNSPPEGCPKGKYREKTIAVGSFPANAWGLHDMHGNVWEWVADVYKPSYEGLDTSDPLHTSDGPYRVDRGSSWDLNASDARAANRSRHGPSLRYNALGFRLLRY